MSETMWNADPPTPPTPAAEAPVPFAIFAAALKGTPDEVYTKLMRWEHGGLPQPMSAWKMLLDALRARPAH